MFRTSKLFARLLTSVTYNTLIRGRTSFRQQPRPRASALFFAMAASQRAVVRSLPDEPNLTITLTVGGRERNLDRSKAEPLVKPLQRIQKSAAAPPDRKKQRKIAAPAGTTNAPSAAPAALFVGLYAGPTADYPLLDPETTLNGEAWLPGRLLRVGDAEYTLHVNPPTVERVDTHGTPFVGIPVVAVPKLRFAAVADCRWRWWRQRRFAQNSAAAWEEISGAVYQQYIPVQDDMGCVLRVACTPTRADSSSTEGEGLEVGNTTETETPAAVAPAPPLPHAQAQRYAATATLIPSPGFRVVTYNILADQYASTDAAKNQLFASCPAECLVPAYRRPLILGELLRYNADVLCLQEVDDRMFSSCLEPALALAGFDGVFTNKAGSVREGAAAFWRRDRFRLVDRRDVALKDLFPKSSAEAAVAAAPCGAAFGPMLRSSPALCTALQRVATIAQLLLLAPVGSNSNSSSSKQLLCVANTHLFFHYAAPHIRTMHVWAILHEAAALAAAHSGGDGAQQPAMLFCGDLNSDLNDGIPGAIELLSAGKLPASHWDWAFGVRFKWDKDEEGTLTAPVTTTAAGTAEGGEVAKMMHTEVEGLRPGSPGEIVIGVDLEAPFALAAAGELKGGVTNYVNGYQGLLDYVWYEPGRLAVDRVIPVPPVPSLGGFIPNRQFPSDHLAVVADLRFTSSFGSTGSIVGGGDSATFSVDATEPGGNEGSGGSGGIGDAVTGPGCVLPAEMYNVGVASKLLGQGGMLAVPTDTIYGLAACASNEAAVARIFGTKGRPDHKPLAICVADHEDIAKYAHVGHLPTGLLEDLLPGAVTVVLPRREEAPLAPGLVGSAPSSLGVRIPDAKFIRAVCRQHRGALALTSANLSGERSALSVKEFSALWPRCDAVFDGGEIAAAGREGSTIVELVRPGQFVILRRGVNLAAVLEKLEAKYKLQQVQQK